MCHKETAVVSAAPSPTAVATAPASPARPASDVSAGRASTATTTTTAPATSNVAPAGSKSGRIVVDQTAQVIVFGYHRFVEKVKRPDTEITPAAFEAQMKELKDKGITVIPMQDFLAWRRSEKSIPPRSAVHHFR